MRGRQNRREKPYVVGVLLVLLAGVGGCADLILLRPPGNPPPCPQATRKNVGTEKVVLEIFVQRSPACHGAEPKAYVLGFTGNHGRAEEMVGWVTSERWADFPVDVWMVNYPGFGGSTGPATLPAIAPAAVAAYDALAKVARGRPIFIDANSFGSSVALHVAAVRPTAGLILKNAPAIREVVVERNGWWNLWLPSMVVANQVPAELDSPVVAKTVHVPAVFLAADDDWLVPPHYQGLVQQAYAGPVTIIRMPGLDHGDRADAPAEQQLHYWIEHRWQETFPITTAAK